MYITKKSKVVHPETTAFLAKKEQKPKTASKYQVVPGRTNARANKRRHNTQQDRSDTDG